MLEKDREHKAELEMLRAQVERLTQENEQLQALRQEVADALISAKGYASDLKQQTESDDQAKRMGRFAVQKRFRAGIIRKGVCFIRGVILN